VVLRTFQPASVFVTGITQMQFHCPIRFRYAK